MILVPTIHPAALLRGREGEAGTARFLQTVIGDFRKARELLERRPTWDESAIWRRDASGRLVALFPTAQEVIAFCARAHSQRRTLFVDVETTGEEALNCRLICVGIADDGGAICIPFLKQGGESYWSAVDYRQVFEALRFVLGADSVPKCFHNGGFDTVVLWAHGLPVGGWVEDTMAAHHVVDGELPHSLAFCASAYLETRYWKEDVKGGPAWLDLGDERLRSYNVRDTLVTRGVHYRIRDQIDGLGLRELYATEVRLAQIMARATIRGLEIDLQRRDDPTLDYDGRPRGLAPRMRLQRDDAFGRLQRIAGGSGFNPRSVIHLRYLLFEALRFPIVKRTDKGAPSTDKDAMVLLALNADRPEQQQALRALIDYRQADKILGTWIDGLKVLGDGRVHPSWKLLTVTGRFSSSPNMQNLGKWIKRIFCAGRGMKFVGVDLSQAEMRVMAYLSGDPELLRMYAEDINVHTVTASLLFQIKCPPEMGDNINPQTEAYLREAAKRFLGLDYDTFPVMPKKQWKPTRTLSKNVGFGHNYGGEPETLYETVRSKRDPDTNDLLFPDVTLGEIETIKLLREQIHPAIPRWWRSVSEQTQKAQRYQCPISGRIRWFRAGFKRTEMINTPIQSFVASWMNRQTIKIADDLDRWAPGAEIVQQVHDALTVEAPEAHVQTVKDILKYWLNQPFSLPGFPKATLPCDEPTVGDYLDEV